MVSSSDRDLPSAIWPPASITIEAPIEQVWAALTDGARLSHWFAGNPALSYPGEGRRRANPTGQTFILSFPNVGQSRDVQGEYLLFSPPHRLVMRFRDEEKTSLVTYALQSEGSRTTIEVTSESQYRSCVVQFFGRLLRRHYDSGLRSSLSNLKQLVESG